MNLALELSEIEKQVSVLISENIEYKNQLTKAKEIIKKMYTHVFQKMDFMELNDYNVLKAEVEQFLKEIEK